VSWDQTSSEERYQLDPVSDLTGHKVFEERWALTEFQEALARLWDESVAARAFLI
jgi:hypothetical protein